MLVSGRVHLWNFSRFDTQNSHDSKEIPSLKLTNCPWKWMVGRRSFPFGMAYFQGRTVSFWEGTPLKFHELIFKGNTTGTGHRAWCLQKCSFFFSWNLCTHTHIYIYNHIYIYIGSTPNPATVTIRIISFLVGNLYKPSYVTVCVCGG